MANLPLGISSLRFCLAAVAIVLTAPSSSKAFSFSVQTARQTRCSSGSSLFSESNSGGVEEYDDFANFSSTQLASSSSTDTTTDATSSASSNNNLEEEEDTFLSSLQSRLQQVEDNSTRLPLMILDTMLPRQILQIQIQHPTLKALMKHRVNEETPTLGMLGMARLSTGQTVPLKTGVEVEIIQMEKATDSPPENTSSRTSTSGEEEGWDISLRGGRRFTIDGEVDKTEDGWTEARVKFLDSSEEEEREISSSMESPSSTDSIGDRLSVARAIQKCKEFTAPNMNMDGSLSLVDRWIELAKKNERHPGQIDVLLQQLGEIPPEHEPTERALWVGALINPLPAMGVATEIRPALLVSKKAEERVQVALDGLLKSIRHMDGSQRLN